MSNETKKESKAFDPEKESIFKKLIDSLTDEQKEKAKNCKDEKELFAVLRGDGVAIPDEELEDVAGGAYYVYDDKAQTYRIYLDDGSYMESQNDKNHAVCVTDFYSYLESVGYFG